MFGGTIRVPTCQSKRCGSWPSCHISEKPSPERMMTWALGPWQCAFL